MIRRAAMAAALGVLFGGGDARAQDAARLFREAVLRRRVTAADARAIEAAVKTPADRTALQAQVDRFADRIVPGAEAPFRRAGVVNLCGPVRAGLGLAGRDGRVTEAELRRVLAAAARDGFSPAERRAFHGALAQLRNPHLARRARVDARAERAARAAETRADRLTPNPYTQRLPARPGELNRFHTPSGGEAWPARSGAPLHDGLGGVRGALVESSARVNFGGRKRLLNQWMVYAWNALVRAPDGSTSRASGWLPETALQAPLAAMPTIETLVPPGGARGARSRVTGGDPAAYAGARIHPNVVGGGQEATDYLLRPGGVVNLLYSLPGAGGVATDTFPAGVVFQRAAQVRAVRIKLYEPGSARRFRIPTLTFVYGRVDVPGHPPRYGWLPLAALAGLRP